MVLDVVSSEDRDGSIILFLQYRFPDLLKAETVSCFLNGNDQVKSLLVAIAVPIYKEASCDNSENLIAPRQDAIQPNDYPRACSFSTSYIKSK